MSYLLNLPHIMYLCCSNCVTNISYMYRSVRFIPAARRETLRWYSSIANSQRAYVAESITIDTQPILDRTFLHAASVEKRRSRIHNSSSAPCSSIGREIKFFAATICRRDHETAAEISTVAIDEKRIRNYSLNLFRYFYTHTRARTRAHTHTQTTIKKK